MGVGLQGRGHHRIDYLLIPQLWQVDPGTAGPNPDIDVSSGTVDHRLVQAVVRVVAPGSQPLTSRRKPCCDKGKLKDPTRALIIRAVLARAPQLPWRMAAGDHDIVVTTFFQKVLRLVVPLSGPAAPPCTARIAQHQPAHRAHITRCPTHGVHSK